MTIGQTGLILTMLITIALTVGCQQSQDAELERIASAIEGSEENYSTLADSVDGMNSRLNVIEVRIDDLGIQVDEIEKQIESNDERMRTYIATEIHKQIGAIENRIDDLASQVDDLKSDVSTQGTGLPKWEQGTSAEEGRALLGSCISGRLGILGELLGAEMFSDDDIREMLGDMPEGMGEINGVRMMGILFGCWE